MNVPNVNFFIGYVNSTRYLVDEEYREMFGEQRKFYSSSKDNDYLKYVETGSNEVMDYVEYSGNKEKSHGVFNQDGLLTPDKIKILRKQLRLTNSVIWHGVISFTEEFGNKYCDNYKKAYEMMKNEMPKFFRNANLNPKNIEWFAGLHENTDNKHIHFSFFEKSPQRYRRNCEGKHFSDGFIQEEVINKTKVSIELNLLKLSSNIAQNRKLLTEELKTDLSLGAFMKEIKSLIFILPTDGRLQYDSENLKRFKPHIDMIINTIISQNENLHDKFISFERILSKRDNELIRAYSQIKVNCSDKLLRDKCIQDLYRRLGNIVLNTVKNIRYEQSKQEYETKKRLQLKRIEKNKRRILIDKCFQLNELVNQEIINAFNEYEQRLAEANYSRLKEEGYLD